MKKGIIALVLCFSVSLSPFTWAMGNRAKQAANSTVQAANTVGNNDAAQQAGGDIGSAIAKGGKDFVNRNWDMGLNNNVPMEKVNQMNQTGARIFATGKAIEYGSKAAPHVGWAATSAGRAYEGDYSGAAIEATNGCARTVTVGKIGTAAGTAVGVWATGKLGAVAGSWAGPLGAGAGFVIGCGAAWLGGYIWDKTIGKGAQAIDQKVHDWKSQSQYGGTRKNPTPVPTATADPTNPGVAGSTTDITRNTARNTASSTARNTTRNITRTIKPPCTGGGTCRPAPPPRPRPPRCSGPCR